MIWEVMNLNPGRVELGVRSTSGSSLMVAERLEQASQWHEMYCHDVEVMISNPGQVELRVRT